jgi:hypothetical protein
MESRKWLINDVPDGPGGRRPNGPRTIAALVAALAVALVAATIAGCGGGSSESSTSTSASVSTTQTTSPQATTTSTDPTTTGSTSGSGGSGHGQTPQQAVNGVLTKAGADNCVAGGGGSNVTEHFIHAAYGDTGGCIHAQNEGAVAKSLGSYSQKITGSTATAQVRPVGGIYDGEKITVSLVMEDGGWKVDGLKSNAPVGP